MKKYWWETESSRIAWFEITRRPEEDIGTNLWVTNPNSIPWTLIHTPKKGAIVFHWDSTRGEIVGYSEVASSAATLGRFGTSSVTKRGGKTWRRPLTNYTAFPSGVFTLANFRRYSSEIKEIHDSLRNKHGLPVHFPFAKNGSSGWRKLKPRQTYLAVCPSRLENLIWLMYNDFLKVNKWAGKPKKISLTANQKRIQSKKTSKRDLNEFYRYANEEVVISDPKSRKLDSEALQASSQAHAKTQNMLRNWLVQKGKRPFSPNASHKAKFDLAWRHNGRLYVCEIKSLKSDNEEQQLRLGLGQVLHYKYLMIRHQKLDVDAVMCVERAPRHQKAWTELASEYGVKLVWSKNYKGLLD